MTACNRFARLRSEEPAADSLLRPGYYTDMAVESLVDEALTLPAAERLRLVERLWDSLREDLQANPAGLPLSDEQLQALDRRAAEMELNPRLGSSWEAVKARLSTEL